MPELEIIPSTHVPERYYVFRDGEPAAVMKIEMAADGSITIESREEITFNKL